MKILCVGDVCGSVGCAAVRERLPELKRKHGIDLTVINGENSADGNGITPTSAESLFCFGADIITGGNHTLRRAEIYPLLDNNPNLLRPHNLPEAQFGSGYCLYDMGRTQVAVINLSGRIFLDSLNASNPFTAADELIERAKSDGAKIIIVDFHAEATSEKRALGLYLDGRVSVFFGTHTHIQTADEQILPLGTGYITDLGMTGPKHSVLGVRSDIIISRLKDKNMQKFSLADGECIFNACVFTVDEKTAAVTKVERIYI